MPITFATPDTIKQPSGGLIIDKPLEQDHVLGATETVIEWEKLVPDGHWRDFQPVSERQSSKYGNTFGCVGFSLNNIHEFIHRKRYNEEINKSDRFTVVGSGTIPGRGNTKRTVAEWSRKNGWVEEWRWPFNVDMTIEGYYNNRIIPPELVVLGLQKLRYTESGYQWLPDNSPKSLLNGLSFSPVQVDVEPYTFNSRNYVINTGQGYTHEVTVFDYEPDLCWWVYDSERDQYVKLDWKYNFGGPMIHYFKKKAMTIKLYKKIGEPAIYIKHWSLNLLIPFMSGYLAGGDLFKSLYNVEKYSDLEREDVEVLPFPVAPYGITTSGLGFVGANEDGLIE